MDGGRKETTKMRVENGFSLRLTKVDLEKLSRGIALTISASCLNGDMIDTLTIRVAPELPELDQPEKEEARKTRDFFAFAREQGDK